MEDVVDSAEALAIVNVYVVACSVLLMYCDFLRKRSSLCFIYLFDPLFCTYLAVLSVFA